MQHACVPYVVYNTILNVKKFRLPDDGGLGNYVVKVYLKTNTKEEKWNLQSLYPLRVE